VSYDPTVELYDTLPYYSTIVFVVRESNPEPFREWPDLVKEGRRERLPVLRDSDRSAASAELHHLV
jgi:ABC-type sulfate transport system substrate-binding protein